MTTPRSLDGGIGRAEGAADAAIRGEPGDPALRAATPALHAGYEIFIVALVAIATVAVSLRVGPGIPVYSERRSPLSCWPSL
jgi:hypothetical protein